MDKFYAEIKPSGMDHYPVQLYSMEPAIKINSENYMKALKELEKKLGGGVIGMTSPELQDKIKKLREYIVKMIYSQKFKERVQR
jgi:aromatic ring hydroxylase